MEDRDRGSLPTGSLCRPYLVDDPRLHTTHRHLPQVRAQTSQSRTNRLGQCCITSLRRAMSPPGSPSPVAVEVQVQPFLPWRLAA